MEMSLTKALAEIKLTDKKLKDVLNNSEYGFIAEGLKHSTVNEKAVKDQDGMQTQKFNDLSKKITVLKEAVAEANIKTTVKYDKRTLSIYALIEEKAAARRYLDLLKKIRRDLKSKQDKVDSYNAKVEAKAADIVGQIYGSNKKANEAEATKLMKAHFDTNKATLFSRSTVEEIDAVIVGQETKISDIDILLSEINSRTVITVKL